MVNKCDCLGSEPPKQMRRIGPTRRSVSGIYAFRGKTAIPFESTLERDFLIRMEFDLRVVDIIPQPVQIPFIANGQRYTYTPDYLVYFRQGTAPTEALLAEVKPRSELREYWQSWKSKFRTALRYAKGRGWQFHIYDESRIRDQALANIRFLDVYKRMHLPPEMSVQIVEAFRKMGYASPGSIQVRHIAGASGREGIAHIWHLLATRRLDCNIDHTLNESTELWIPIYE